MARALRTRFTTQLGAAPVILAPMGGCAGGALAAAVTEAGAVGLVGSGGESLDFLRREWAVALAAPHDRDLLGFGLNVGQLDGYAPRTLEALLLAELGPKHVYLSFGDCGAYASAVKNAGATLYSNCGDSEGAVAHAEAGVDVVVAQGSDAGGHTHPTASAFALVPQARAALDAAGHGSTLLAAAGGIADGRGLAAALVLGADAGVLGTTFAAAPRVDVHRLPETRRRRDDVWSTRLEAAYLAADDAGRAELRAEHDAGVQATGEGLEWGATPAEASREYANEAAAYLSAAVHDAEKCDEYACQALCASTLALERDPDNARARLRLGKVFVLLGDVAEARKVFRTLAGSPDADVADEAARALDRLAQRDVTERHAKHARAKSRHLDALGLAPAQGCSTPDVKQAHATQQRRHEFETSSRRRESVNRARSALKAAHEAYEVLLPTETRRKYLWNFDTVGKRVQLGAALGGEALVLDYDEPTNTHLVQLKATGAKRRVKLEAPDDAGSGAP
ncbi:2-nitropropane dioxygenase [Aureococcus anophagefferens]|nr:2-nitropropane dioxygenase [Aureococcus anophagefferens]